MQELALLLGIVIAEWIILYPSALDSSGYIWLALKRTSGLLFAAIVARWIVGWVLLRLSLLKDSELCRSWKWAAAIGLITVLLPSSFDYLLGRMATTKSFRKALVQVLLKVNLLTGQTVKRTIQKLKEQDDFDCQNSKRWWDFGASPEQMQRRLRILYEMFKLEIANDRREPELLRYDVDISPGQKFYLLVAHLGRKRLRRTLEEVSHLGSWRGEERRRRSGVKADRRSPDPNPHEHRIYDNEELRERIQKGEAVKSSVWEAKEELTSSN
jgi:hypothetical protein